ncbi:MAG TPA: DUF4232 domain-containing protein [Acidimicrobiales bacterium]|jgi:hypothetical protein
MRRRRILLEGSRTTNVITVAAAMVLVASLFIAGFAGRLLASSAAATPECTTAKLDVWLNTNGNGAAGSSYYDLNLTNLSASTCTLYGYPGISAITQAGAQVGSAGARSSAHAVSVITLTSARSAKGLETSTAHNTATVVLQIADAENFPQKSCVPITAAGFRVYPPNQKESTVVPYPFVACAKTGPRVLHVEAVQRYVASQ